MTLIDLLIHLLNFAAPAVVVALTVGIASYFWTKKPRLPHILWRFVAINFIVCLGALLVGLWVFGRDGKMQTYFGMVLACGSCQWLLSRGWRR